MVYYTPATSHRAVRMAPRAQLCAAGWAAGRAQGARPTDTWTRRVGTRGGHTQTWPAHRHEGVCATHTGTRTMAPSHPLPGAPCPSPSPHRLSSSLRGGGLQPPPPCRLGQGPFSEGWVVMGRSVGVGSCIPCLGGATVHCRSLSPSSLHMRGQRPSPGQEAVTPLLWCWAEGLEAACPGDTHGPAACLPPRRGGAA